ncbi:hypothetical protein GCM10018790_56680 [Kitasatospora xanthocidica]|nr:hypothetical protein GCM10018790_56680 [Kitasatospora xanthocidica]
MPKWYRMCPVLIPARAAMSDIRTAAGPFSAMALIAARIARPRASSPLGWRFRSAEARAGCGVAPGSAFGASPVVPSGERSGWGRAGSVSGVGMASPRVWGSRSVV